MSLQIVIASRLVDGRVIYLADGRWTSELGDARVAEDDAGAAELLATARKFVATREVVDPYLIEIVEDSGTRKPAKWREHIRSRGPTVRTDLGYQAGELA